MSGEDIESLEEDAKRILEELLQADETLVVVGENGKPRYLTIQVEIQQLQQRIQRQIRALKAGTRGVSFDEDLARLRKTMNRAKSLGDTFVWMFMGFDGARIGLLSENSQPPVHSEDEIGDMGVIAAAENALASGWGLPVLHDISSVLRIGDLSLITFDGKGQDQIQTFEIKTRYKGMADDGSHILEVSFLSVGTPPPLPPEAVELARKDGDAVSSNPWRPRRSDARINRQWRRLEKVHVAAKSMNQGPVKLPDGQRTQFMTVEGEAAPWPKEFFRDLLDTSVASALLDPYTVIFGLRSDSQEDSKAKIENSRLAEHVLSLRHSEDPDEFVYVQTLPLKQTGGSMHPRIYTTLDIPKEIQFEMFAGTAVINVITTFSAVKKAYSARGFLAEREPVDGGSDWGDFYLLKKLLIDDVEYNLEMHHEGWQLLKSMLELKGVNDAAAMAEDMAVRGDVEKHLVDHLKNRA